MPLSGVTAIAGIVAVLMSVVATPSDAADAALMAALRSVECSPRTIALLEGSGDTQVYDVACAGAPQRDVVVSCLRTRCDPSGARSQKETDQAD